MLEQLFFILWFFLPAGLANMFPIFAARLPGIYRYSQPLDCGFTFRGRRIFGDHKTWRGLIVGIFVAILTVALQKHTYANSLVLQNSLPVDYFAVNPIIFGALSALGALLGDAIKSFFKRQINVPSGESWFPFDQADYIIGGIIFTYLYIPLSFEHYAGIFLVWFPIHLIATSAGYLLKLKAKAI
jgi:CDP-2,3-bis-(O-geranylgeranyl)-sn-glycerol synthase